MDTLEIQYLLNMEERIPERIEDPTKPPRAPDQALAVAFYQIARVIRWRCVILFSRKFPG